MFDKNAYKNDRTWSHSFHVSVFVKHVPGAFQISPAIAGFPKAQ
jgi:hypothetical protein